MGDNERDKLALCVPKRDERHERRGMREEAWEKWHERRDEAQEKRDKRLERREMRGEAWEKRDTREERWEAWEKRHERRGKRHKRREMKGMREETWDERHKRAHVSLVVSISFLDTHDSIMCEYVTWLIHVWVCDMTHSCVSMWHDSFMCDYATWLAHVWVFDSK